MKHAVEIAFLPAALEIEQTPPSPLGRAILWSILAFFVAAFAWAWFGSVDIVAVAHGRLIPSGHSKVVQPLVMGTVRAIHVSEGQQVRAGDILLELDSSEARSDLERLSHEKQQARDEVTRLETLRHWLETDKQKPAAATVETPEPLLAAQWQEYLSRLVVLERERERRQAETESARRQVDKLSGLLPIATQRARDQQRLAAKKLLPEQQYLESEQQRLTLYHDLKAQGDKVTELKAATRELDARIELTRHEYARDLGERLRDARLRAASLEQETMKAKARLASHRLTAPVDGIAQQLEVHNTGAVVTPAQQLLIIVPAERQLEVEAYLENKDIGFVATGQEAEIKVEAFPFTKYGTLHGRIIDLSNDAIADEQRGWVYKMRVGIDTQQLLVDGRGVALSPGMTVTAECKTGKRRLIDFFLSPLLRYRDESVRER